MAENHETGTVESGDVTIFYRLFGKPGGGRPVFILHGANYYDSADWIEVAAALAKDRQVVAFDQRGFGKSTWSPSKNYSNDAVMGDCLALMDKLGWKTAVAMGHSRGGGHAILFGARHADRCAGVVLVDHCPSGPGGGGVAGRGGPTGGPASDVFAATVEEAQKKMSRDLNTPPGSAARRRLEEILKPVAGGFKIERDPAFGSQRPQDDPNWKPRIVVEDMWAELAAIKAPKIVVRGTRSDRYDDAAVKRVEGMGIPMVHLACGHDVANGAPEGLIEAVAAFLRETVDGAKVGA